MKPNPKEKDSKESGKQTSVAKNPINKPKEVRKGQTDNEERKLHPFNHLKRVKKRKSIEDTYENVYNSHKDFAKHDENRSDAHKNIMYKD